MTPRQALLVPVIAGFAAGLLLTAMLQHRPGTVSACGVAGPFDFDTLESGQNVDDYARLIELAAYGRAVGAPYADPPLEPIFPTATNTQGEPTATETGVASPAETGTASPAETGTASPVQSPTPILEAVTETGDPPAAQAAATATATEPPEGAQAFPDADFSFQGLERGPRDSRTDRDRSTIIPPTIMKSIAWVEANWTNAESDGPGGDFNVPWGSVGPILRSFDCGYGLGQVTTGMANSTGNASVKQALIGTHPAFNLAESVRILADKWNAAPELRPIAGTGDPFALEDWYYAIWSYNGFAEVNHPLNPFRDPLRGDTYHCWSDDAPNVNSGFGYGDYTYPERVYGCMRFPPLREADGGETYLWPPVEFSMPAMDDDGVAAALALEAYRACADDDLSGGCANMDFPTTLPAITGSENPEDDRPAIGTHQDPTVVDLANYPSSYQPGSPSLVITGESEVEITFSVGEASSAPITVSNVGTGIGPFRITTTANWLFVRNAEEPWLISGGDPFRTLDGSIAIGSDVTVKSGIEPDQFTQGYVAQLEVSVDPRRYPGESQTATVTIEPLVGTGAPFTMTVHVEGGQPAGVGGSEDDPRPHRAVVPGIATSE